MVEVEKKFEDQLGSGHVSCYNWEALKGINFSFFSLSISLFSFSLLCSCEVMGPRSIARKIFKPRAAGEEGSSAQNRGKQPMQDDSNLMQPASPPRRRIQKSKGKMPIEAERESPKKFISMTIAIRFEELKNRDMMLERGSDSNLDRVKITKQWQ
ncbi:MAG: hypothetical protein Q8754_02740 [Sweet potato little leaf phytoplasma]|nr:hypothetical protein [Sweet potato little leaf phytoplasma]